MKTIQLEDSAIDQILVVLQNDKSKYASESQKIAAKICEQCQVAEEEDSCGPDQCALTHSEIAALRARVQDIADNHGQVSYKGSVLEQTAHTIRLLGKRERGREGR